MNTRAYIPTAFLLFLIWIPSTALADLIILKNGNQLKVEKAWQEDDQVCFIFNEIKASIPQSKVVRIEAGRKKPKKADTPDNLNPAAKTGQRRQSGDGTPLNQSTLKTKTVAAEQQKANRAKTAPAPHLDGIGGLKWGMRAAGITGLESKQTDSGLKEVIEYIRPSDGLKLGEAELTSIVYAFWRDKLYTVTLWTRGVTNFKALRQKIFEQFGPGSHPDPDTERYLWSNGKSDMMLKYTNDDEYGFFWMRAKAVDRKFKLSQMSGHTSYLKWMKSRK